MTFSIRHMTEKEIRIAIDWAREQGWNPGLHDAECFYAADHKGFFIGELDGQTIAVGSAVAYDDNFGFCGLYIVKPEFRQHGYGMELTHARLNYLGNRTVGLDGVLDKVDKYERLGYVKAHLNQRYKLSTNPRFQKHPRIKPVNQIPFEVLSAFDRRYFPASRIPFLRKWISQKDSFADAYFSDGQCQGYGVIRRCGLGYKIGPLFAKTSTVAKTVFESLCSQVTEGPVYLDVPQPNAQALALVKEYQMSVEFEVIRMYRNGRPNIDLNGVYGITTYELG